MRRIPFLVLVSLLLLPRAAGAVSSWGAEVYTGITLDTQGQGSAYVGGGVDRPWEERWAWTAKFLVQYLRYRYDSLGREIEAEAPDVKLQAGVKYSRPGTYLVLTGGLDYRSTDLDPRDPDAEVEGGQAGVTAELVGGRNLTEKVALAFIGSYTSIGDGLWGRVRLTRELPWVPRKRKLRAGVEAVGQGNQDYSAYQVGAVLELVQPGQRSSYALASGYSDNDGVPDSAYFRLEYYHRF
ncbi:MAG: cellulose biosynthesis protein BcsS [Nitrospirota bacterium]|jgi:hypothetical protein